MVGKEGGIGVKTEEQLVEENMKLVYYIANKYPPHTALPVEDRVQEGSIGLLNAIRKYDPSKNVTFSAFAGMYIEWAISNAMRNSNPVKVSTDVTQLMAHMKKHDITDMPIEELVERTKESRTVVKQALSYMETEFASLDFELGWRNDDEDGDMHKLLGFDEDFETRLVLEDCLAHLPPDIRKYFELQNKGYSLVEIGEMYGKSSNLIQYHMNKSKKKMQEQKKELLEV